jgi:hypothetical protein
MSLEMLTEPLPKEVRNELIEVVKGLRDLLEHDNNNIRLRKQLKKLLALLKEDEQLKRKPYEKKK